MTFVHPGQCRQCRSRVLVVRTETGRMISLDPQPALSGHVVMVDTSEGARAHIIRKGDHYDHRHRYRIHAATCGADPFLD